ncbi:MAG: hypothetical protein ABI995_12015 [Acidobacteriota bacterium]
MQPGTRVGAYLIETHLGDSRLGPIYRALDTRMNRAVTIRVLSKSDAGRIGQAASALNHSSILKVYEAGEWEGWPYLVTEFVDGAPVAEWAKAERRDWRTILELMVPVTEGLAVAHAAGITHGGITLDGKQASSILVAKNGRAKLADFGFANGEAGDPREDVQAIGAVLYELLSGRPAAVAASTPLGELVPKMLRLIVEKAMAKDPAERYPTARELASAMRSLIRTRPDAAAKQAGPLLSNRVWWSLAAALALGVVGIAIWKWNPPISRGDIQSIVVLRLTNETGDPQSDYLSDGVTQGVIQNLSRTTLKVIPRSTAFQATTGASNPAQIGKQLNVAALLTGRLKLRGDQLEVQAELIDALNGASIWKDRFTRPRNEAQDLEQDIATRIAGILHANINPAKSNLRVPRTGNAKAYDFFLQGQYYRNRYSEDGFRKAVDAFNAAVKEDPAFSAAYAGLALSYALQGTELTQPSKVVMPLAIAAADKAIALDGSLPEAHTARAIAAMFYEWNWMKAEAELVRAIGLDPDSSNTLHFWGHYLEAAGRSVEAVSAMQRAAELDPLASIINTEYGFSLYIARKYTLAEQALRKTLEVDPGSLEGPRALAQVLERMGRAEEGGVEMYRRRSSGWLVGLAELACARAGQGNAAEAMRVLEEVQGIGRNKFVDPVTIAMVYAELRDSTQTFRWLNQGLQDKSAQLALALVDPRLDTFRIDPRFAELARGVNQPASR